MPEERTTTDSLVSELEQLHERVAELEARLGKDSHNSSKPPSSDPPFRKPPPRSQRKASGRKAGGQKGRKGTTRALVGEPDHLVVMALEGAYTCGRCRSMSSCCPSGAKSSSWSSAAR